MISDQGTRAQRCKGRNGEIESRLADPGFPPTTFGGKAIRTIRPPRTLDNPETPHDKKDGGKRKLERNLHDRPWPVQADDQRGQAQAAQNLLFTIQQHRQHINSNHNGRAHGGNHGARQRGIKQDGQER